jgi:hypothetical protein
MFFSNLFLDSNSRIVLLDTLKIPSNDQVMSSVFYSKNQKGSFLVTHPLNFLEMSNK